MKVEKRLRPNIRHLASLATHAYSKSDIMLIVPLSHGQASLIMHRAS